MLKQMKKTLCILLAVLFVVSLTGMVAVAAPHDDHGGHEGHGHEGHGHEGHGYEGHGYEGHGYEEHGHEGHGHEY